MRLYEITWRDSFSDKPDGHTWVDLEKAKKWGVSGVTVYTVGYLVHEDKKSITLACTQHGEAVSGLWNIPKGCIIRRRRLNGRHT